MSYLQNYISIIESEHEKHDLSCNSSDQLIQKEKENLFA